jgi:SAM-dependent methyltransferase
LSIPQKALIANWFLFNAPGPTHIKFTEMVQFVQSIMEHPSNPPSPNHRSLRHRLFAWATARSGSRYEDALAGLKSSILGSLHGAVLEIGPGAGPNLRYYSSDVHWLGVEPNPYMHAYLNQAIVRLGRPDGHFQIEPGDAGGVRLPAAEASMDAVVSTLVLCSVPYPEATLQEILRVLKPGGRFVFIEHVAAEGGTRLRSFQDFLQPVWTFVGDGCHPNRETWSTISQAGFSQVDIQHFRHPNGGPASPHISGTGVK